MEIINLKPFDLEKAKNGASVCLSDETKVKILDFDFNSHILFKTVDEQFGSGVGSEVYHAEFDGEVWDDDRMLMMAPVCGYMAIFIDDRHNKLYGSEVFRTKEDAAKDTEKLIIANKVFCFAKVELIDIDDFPIQK